jgi:hypothetical protein
LSSLFFRLLCLFPTPIFKHETHLSQVGIILVGIGNMLMGSSRVDRER